MTYLPIILKERIMKSIVNRHYYLKKAKIFVKLNNISEMHSQCRLAEKEQDNIDEFIKFNGAEKVKLY